MARGFIDGEYTDGELRGLGFLAGERGMGKTTEMARLLDQCAGGALFYDTLGKHGKLLRGYTVIRQPGELKRYLIPNRERRFRIRYVPAVQWGDQEAQQTAHLRAVCTIVAALGRMIFAIDEVDQFCGSEWGDKRMPPELYDLAHYGRHYPIGWEDRGERIGGVSMLVTARDPVTLSIKFRSQCGSFRIFRTTEEAYMKFFGSRIGKANTARLSSLPQYQYLFWQAGTSEARVCGGRR